MALGIGGWFKEEVIEPVVETVEDVGRGIRGAYQDIESEITSLDSGDWKDIGLTAAAIAAAIVGGPPAWSAISTYGTGTAAAAGAVEAGTGLTAVATTTAAATTAAATTTAGLTAAQWASVMTGVGATTSGASAYVQYQAGEAAKEFANRAAGVEASNTAEKVKRVEEDNARRMGLAKARSAASGVGGETVGIYLEALQESGREEIAWLKEVGASAYQARIEEGQSAYSSAQAGMWGSIGQSATYGSAALT